MGEWGAADLAGAGDGGDGGAVGQHADNQAFLGVAFVFPLGFEGAGGAAQAYAFGAFAGQCLARPLAYEIALDLGGKAEREGQHLALDIVAEPVIVLDGPDAAFLCHTDI